MRGRQILIGALGGLEAAALMEDGRLVDFLLDAPDHPRPGAIYQALCDRVAGGQGGAIVRLTDRLTGYLRQAEGLAPGQRIAVQVTGYSSDGKAVPVSLQLTFRAPLAVVTPLAPGLNLSRRIKDPEARARLKAIAGEEANPAWGLVLRTDAGTAPDKAVAQSIRSATEAASRAMDALAKAQGPECVSPGSLPGDLARQEWTGACDEDADFELQGVLEAMEALEDPEVALSTGRMTIQPTRAFVAIDIDTGGDFGPAAALKANRAAMADLPRQLRLRGLGGQIVIDAAPVGKARRAAVETALRAALADDPIPTTIAGWTPLGHLELQRRRDRLPVMPRLKGLL